jgi:HAD superfamily hydrolase (TIGR01509 family)
MRLTDIRHWVFDMDGTLTIAAHDFGAIRAELGIPAEDDILGHLAALPAEEAAAKHAWLLAHERDVAIASRPAPGAVALVRTLAERGHRLGILTRNARELAHITLAAIGIDDCFAPEHILGRDEAAFKPDPEGLLKLATAWRVQPANMVMVGDYRFDLAAGRAAGTRTVLVNLPENPWPELTDWHAVDCEALLGMV